MDTEHTRKARETTDNAVLTALRTAGEAGMLPGELAATVPSIGSGTLTKSLRRLITARQIRRDSERGRAYALPLHDDGSPMTVEDIAAEAAAQHARFLSQRDSDVAKVETAARIDLRKLDPRLRHIATGRSTYLLRFAETLRQCNTQTAYDAVSRAFDADFTEIEAKWSQAQLELQQEKDRQEAVETQQREWNKQRALADKPRKAITAGHPGVQWRTGKSSKKAARMAVRKNWEPIYGQQLFPQPAPANAPRCRHCHNDPLAAPAMYLVNSPLFETQGRGLCDRHAEQERYGPDTQVHLIQWS